MTNVIVLAISLFWIFGQIKAQELQCQVTIQAPRLQSLDRSILEQLKQAITQYLNQNKWTNDHFEPHERIRCNITIIIQTNPSVDRFEGTMQIQVIRPVYASTYETVIFNYIDKDFKINYNPMQPLQFSTTTYIDNLTSILNFWAYMILGFDYDSFGKGSGIPYFRKAQEILNLAQESGESGWKALDGTNNRYWVLENMLNGSYQVLHQVYYDYHRKALDHMYQDVDQGREIVLQCLDQLRKLFQSNPNTIMPRIFVRTKTQELVQMFRNATDLQKQRFLQIIRQLDPANMRYYNQIKERQ